MTSFVASGAYVIRLGTARPGRLLHGATRTSRIRKATSTSTEAELPSFQPPLRRSLAVALRPDVARYVAGVLLLAAAYYGAAKVGQTLRYTGSVAAIWPPAGLGIAVLYLWGLRWWPGVLIGEFIVNGELLLDETALPLQSVVGQQAGNMLEIVLGAVLLRRLVGPHARLDRVEQVGGMLVALGIATAISATVGTLSMLAGGVIAESEAPTFWRTWWLGDTAGGLVVLPLMLVWARDPAAASRPLRTWQGAVLIATVAALGLLAISSDEPVTYLVFPALIWAAFRFGPPGATLAIAIAAGVAIGFTANELGPFFKQSIDHRTLSTQVYIVVAALTTLFLGAVVSERERSARVLAEVRLRAGELAMEERHRIARDLHDSVSQALFSTVLHTRTAERALAQEGVSRAGPLARSLAEIGDLSKIAQSEMRALIYELGHEAVAERGLVAALSEHAARLGVREEVIVDIRGPADRLPLSPLAEGQLFSIGREALTNVVKHAGATTVRIRVDVQPGRVAMVVEDDGRGFEPATSPPGHFGLKSMRSRAAELGGQLRIASEPGGGTVIRVEVPVAGTEGDGA
jgi:signal transduction histidine kinase